MIPMELISMGASTVLGGILSIMAQKGKDEAEKQIRRQPPPLSRSSLIILLNLPVKASY